MQKSSSIVYFDREGNDNLLHVLRVLKRSLKKRPELRDYKILFFTAVGKGPALAYNQLEEFNPAIYAITFPPSFCFTVEDRKIFPTIPEKIRRFFDGVGIKVITGRLPFDQMEGAPAHNEQMKLIKSVLSLFGGSMSQCIQAALQACDSGEVKIGERVISVTGDCATILSASTTERFLSKESGLVVHEILCKPRQLTLARKTLDATSEGKLSLSEEQSKLTLVGKIEEKK